ncbi:MerR family transcriptional regulator [Amycolatopsis antarctica]|uniref:MerR family transcriptional regulator n=1 Tax=Amycolatopsis antarctica TaxID=1854586 RepID=A0A263CZ69_9PSEU|nr:MerR family transcriptional regulator [Amycolatopsis antarctica]OZM71188.1 MerR family transcriptional regulator [Amycolatopsis antarctica]
MAWSTREIAELAGTSVRAVRHYHEVGLLAEPERGSNGYKRYGVAHLLRLLRVKRLTDLGLSLSQIAEMGDDDEHPHEALRTLDAELAETIERLQQARVELASILRQGTPTDLPAELELTSATVETDMTEADRSFMVVLTRVLGPEGLQAHADLLRDGLANPVYAAFENLPEDADDETCQDLAERLAPYVRAMFADHPGLRTASADAPRGTRFANNTMNTAIRDLYNAGQVKVLGLMGPLLKASPPDKPATDPAPAETPRPESQEPVA